MEFRLEMATIPSIRGVASGWIGLPYRAHDGVRRLATRFAQRDSI